MEYLAQFDKEDALSIPDSKEFWENFLMQEAKHGSKSGKQLGVGSGTELCKSESGQWSIRNLKGTFGSLPGHEFLDEHAGFFAERYE